VVEADHRREHPHRYRETEVTDNSNTVVARPYDTTTAIIPDAI